MAHALGATQGHNQGLNSSEVGGLGVGCGGGSG